MRKKIVAGNWKMNKTPSETKEFIAVNAAAFDSADVDVVLCVPFIAICPATKHVSGTSIAIGAQNMHYEDAGAYTGEISAAMLKDRGVAYVIVGHSERRAYFGETDEVVNKKAKKAIAEGLTPIICVGETLEQRNQGITEDLVRLQTKIAFDGISAADAAKAVIAYEPVWAIGTGVTATSEQAEEVCAAIRKLIAEIYDKATADAIRIQYGGSVTADNAKELFSQPNIDGGLVGGASIKPDFAKIIHYNK